MSRVERHFRLRLAIFLFLPLPHRRDFSWGLPTSASAPLEASPKCFVLFTVYGEQGIGEKVTSCELLVEYRLQRIRHRHNNILSEVQRTSGFGTIVSGSYEIMSLASVE
jgi:hypothetical protein